MKQLFCCLLLCSSTMVFASTDAQLQDRPCVCEESGDNGGDGCCTTESNTHNEETLSKKKGCGCSK